MAPASGTPVPAAPVVPFNGNLDAHYTFANFVEGRSNQLGLAAAFQAAQKPGDRAHNPLLLYGGTGLGKTHLMLAAGNAMRQANPGARVLYLRSEQFFSAMIRALQEKAMDQFKRQFQQVDALLIDDIQFFAGKDRTQEEFFHTFNALFDGKQQIILTCDRYPREVEGLEARLKSRLAWGLSVAIEPPDFETRAAIVLAKARERGAEIPDDVAFLIAKKMRSNVRDLEDLIFYSVLGVVLGGRLGYVLFYKPSYYLAHPLEVAYLWEGGMSFHGGLIGVILVMLLFARKKRLPFFAVSDFIAPLIPLGLGFGRLGNFINGELWGRPTDVPWAMIFPSSGDGVPRHPSQLYELGLEGIVLFALMWWFSSKPRPLGQVSAVFLMGYGTFRFLVEFTREPDNFLGLLAGGLSMGQWLSLPMVALGAIMFALTAKRSSR